MDTQTNTNPKSVAAGLLAAIGTIAVIGLVVWGGAQAVQTDTKLLANVTAAVTNFTKQFFPADNNSGVLAFTLLQTDARADEAFTFSWERSGDVAGSYTLEYACTGDVTFERPGAGAIPCDSPYRIGTSAQTLTVIPRSEASDSVSVAVLLTFTPDGKSAAVLADEAIIHVASSAAELADITEPAIAAAPAVTPSAGAPRSETRSVELGGAAPSAFAPPTLFGLPDLSVRILSFGIIDSTTKLFTTATTIPSNAEAAIRFEVSNVGTNVSGPWSFSSTLPTISTYVFRPNEPQQPLMPGERIEYTLSFDHVRHAETGLVTVDVDPSLSLTEITRDNNHAEVSIPIEVVR